jgi:hypothetical protein
VLAGFGIGVARSHTTWTGLAHRNDGWWYLYIAAHGYGHALHAQGVDRFHARFSPWAFYPGFPLVVREVHTLTSLPYAAAGYVAASVFGLAAVLAVAALTATYVGPAAAAAAGVLVSLWPGSAVLSLPYSEGLFIAAAATSLLALRQRRWWVAGVCGYVATFTRALGLALFVAAAVAATRAFRERRDLPALVAPLLTAAGALSFFCYGWWRTRDALVWRHAEDLWRQRFDFGASVFWHFAHDLLTGDRREPTTLMLALGLLALVGGLVAARRGPRMAVDANLITYAGVACVLLLGYGHVGPRPRMVLAVIPVFVWVAAALSRRVVAVAAIPLTAVLAVTAYAYATSVVP